MIDHLINHIVYILYIILLLGSKLLFYHCQCDRLGCRLLGIKAYFWWAFPKNKQKGIKDAVRVDILR